ncbi:hypothetical protein MPLA_800012 [Mesorhizobium sp. ORS 3359]|nr:hypothetical protein MPLA_800012 [Mesorhizobium sp. ORS 3359]
MSSAALPLIILPFRKGITPSARWRRLFLDQIRSNVFGREGDEADRRVSDRQIMQVERSEHQVNGAARLRFWRLVEHDIHRALAQGLGAALGEFMADEEDIAASAVFAQHLVQCGVGAAGIVEAGKVGPALQRLVQLLGITIAIVKAEKGRDRFEVPALLDQIVEEAAHAVAVHAVDLTMADRDHLARPPLHLGHEQPGHAASGVIVDADIGALGTGDLSDDLHRRDVLRLQFPQGVADQRMVGHGENERRAAQIRLQDAFGDRRRLRLVEKGTVHGDRAVECRGDALEGIGKTGEEGRVRPDQDHLDANDAAMRLRQPARIIERTRRRHHLLDGVRPNPAPAVQHALDRGRANTGAARNIKEGGLMNLGPPLPVLGSLASRTCFSKTCASLRHRTRVCDPQHSQPKCLLSGAVTAVSVAKMRGVASQFQTGQSR